MRASKKNECKLVLKEELDSMESSNTWIHTDYPPGKDALPCGVVLKRSLDEQGRIAHYNARLLANSYVHMEGVD